MKKFFLMVCFVFLAGNVFGDVSVTVYQSGKASITDTRNVVLRKGEQTVKFENIASRIDTASILAKFLDDASARIVEQSFNYDKLDRATLLNKSIGKQIVLERVDNGVRNRLSGTLLAITNEGLIVESNGSVVLNPVGEIYLPKGAAKLYVEPTLTWLVSSQIEGTKRLELSYQATDISWFVNYVLILNDNETSADMVGWVTITNNSGVTYKDAKLKLVAGDLQTAKPVQAEMRVIRAKEASYKMAPAASEDFESREFFEYHMYDLQRKVTIEDKDSKQIEFVSIAKIPVKKVYSYNGKVDGKKVSVVVDFNNTKVRALPRGKIRVSKYDKGSLDLVGESNIEHTPESAKISVPVGSAFDITGERVQVDYEANDRKETARESIKITLKNTKDVDVEVKVVEEFKGYNNWEIQKNSFPYTKTNSTTAEFLVKIPAKSQINLTYEGRYSWK